DVNVHQLTGDAAVVSLFVQPHIQHGDPVQVVVQPIGVDFRDTAVVQADIRPIGHRREPAVLRAAAAQVGRYRFVNQLRMGQAHGVHELDEVSLVRLSANPHVEGFFLSYTADGATMVIVAGVDQTGI